MNSLPADIKREIYQYALSPIEVENPKIGLSAACDSFFNILLTEKFAYECKEPILSNKIMVRKLAEKYWHYKDYGYEEKISDPDCMLFVAVGGSNCTKFRHRINESNINERLIDITNMIKLHPNCINAGIGEIFVNRTKVPALATACSNGGRISAQIPISIIKELLDAGANPNQKYNFTTGGGNTIEITPWLELEFSRSEIQPERYAEIEALFLEKTNKEEPQSYISWKERITKII